MTEESDFKDLMFIDEDMPVTGIARWVPTAVVITAVVSFVTLAWYAYHSNTQSLKDDELLVVEADKTPVKEKPADPGGMKFPNQDKTIFNTFASNGQVPSNVERVLPRPEEPVAKDADDSGTSTFINEKHKSTSEEPKTEQVIGTDKKVAMADNQTETYIAPDTNKTPKPLPAAAPAKEAKKEAAPTAGKVAKPASSGNARIQLGAYRSEKEAHEAYAKIQKKYSALAGKDPVIVKADLGDKGIYYRLRVGGMGNASDAKAFCAKLSASGQPCLIPND